MLKWERTGEVRNKVLVANNRFLQARDEPLVDTHSGVNLLSPTRLRTELTTACASFQDLPVLNPHAC